jgi:hypothetical protein
LKELQSVLFNYYKDELRKKTDHYWQENNLTDAWMEEIMYGHNRIHK